MTFSLSFRDMRLHSAFFQDDIPLLQVVAIWNEKLANDFLAKCPLRKLNDKRETHKRTSPRHHIL